MKKGEFSDSEKKKSTKQKKTEKKTEKKLNHIKTPIQTGRLAKMMLQNASVKNNIVTLTSLLKQVTTDH